MKKVKLKDWQAGYPDYSNVWSTERPDWPNWDKIKDDYMGKRTMLVYEPGHGTCLEIEGLHFQIVD